LQKTAVGVARIALQVLVAAGPDQSVGALLGRPQLAEHPLAERRHRGLHGRRVGPARVHGGGEDVRVVPGQPVGQHHLLPLVLRVHRRAIELAHLLVLQVFVVELLREHAARRDDKLAEKKTDKYVASFLLTCLLSSNFRAEIKIKFRIKKGSGYFQGFP